VISIDDLEEFNQAADRGYAELQQQRADAERRSVLQELGFRAEGLLADLSAAIDNQKRSQK